MEDRVLGLRPGLERKRCVEVESDGESEVGLRRRFEGEDADGDPTMEAMESGRVGKREGECASVSVTAKPSAEKTKEQSRNLKGAWDRMGPWFSYQTKKCR